eukprot:gnl/Chilomastix_cuspidata/2568.p1 GENE.gnl/Chilomastix_cuspidata/2568~~gnl/Chilomastix_cuspidata/2568.p1  ORF type:complete len:868 (-),score=295.70 gnl/Chilomastix_cuspidata/2568:740-3070(-)
MGFLENIITSRRNTDPLIKLLANIRSEFPFALKDIISLVEQVHSKMKIAFRPPSVVAALFGMFDAAMEQPLAEADAPTAEELLGFLVTTFSAIRDPLSAHRILTVAAGLLRALADALSNSLAARVAAVVAAYFPVTYRPTPAQAARLPAARLREAHVACTFGHPLIFEDAIDTAMDALFDPAQAAAFDEGCRYILLALRTDWAVWRAQAQTRGGSSPSERIPPVSAAHTEGEIDIGRLDGRQIDIWNCIASAACEQGILRAGAEELLRVLIGHGSEGLIASVQSYILREFQYGSGARMARAGVAALSRVACEVSGRVAEFVAEKVPFFLRRELESDAWRDASSAAVEVLYGLAVAGALPADTASLLDSLLERVAKERTLLFDVDRLVFIVRRVGGAAVAVPRGLAAMLFSEKRARGLVRALALKFPEKCQELREELPDGSTARAWTSRAGEDLEAAIRENLDNDSTSEILPLLAEFAHDNAEGALGAFLQALPRVLRRSAQDSSEAAGAFRVLTEALRVLSDSSAKAALAPTLAQARARAVRQFAERVRAEHSADHRMVASAIVAFCGNEADTRAFLGELWPSTDESIIAFMQGLLAEPEGRGLAPRMLHAIPICLSVSGASADFALDLCVGELGELQARLGAQSRVAEPLRSACVLLFSLIGAGGAAAPGVAEAVEAFVKTIASHQRETAPALRGVVPLCALVAPRFLAARDLQGLLLDRLMDIPVCSDAFAAVRATLAGAVVAALPRRLLAGLAPERISGMVTDLCEAARRGAA